jgi:hypothetical protein
MNEALSHIRFRSLFWSFFLHFSSSRPLHPNASLRYTPFEICLHKKVADPFTECSNRTHSFATYGMDSEQRIPSTCTFGSGHFIVGGASILSGNLHNGLCKTRGLADRPIFEAGNVSIFTNLFESLVEKKIRRVALIGDSISVQLATFLSCDLLRSGFKISKCDENISTAVNIFSNERMGGCDLVEYLNPSGSHNITVGSKVYFYSKRMGLRAVDNPATRNRIDQVMLEDTEAPILPFMRAPGASLVLLNAGLHLHRTGDANVTHSIKVGLGKALYSVASRLRKQNNYLMFRETTSQHFPDGIDGLYETLSTSRSKAHFAAHPTSMCCDIINTTAPRYHSDSDLISILNSINASWSSVLGWVPLYQSSLSLQQYHVEKGRDRYYSRDCTHYIYAPGISSFLVNNLIAAINTL